MPSPFSIRSYPRAILHVDGDAFFVSCEVAKNPALRGKAVITGKERGIASALSYEAKARGVVRGMRLSEIRKVCPDAIMLPSDYETYSLYSRRMYDIVRRYTPAVEEYSIDECFADLTGLRRSLRMSYEEIAPRVKRELEGELGMTFSVGLGPSKVLAKVASKWQKPSGLALIPASKAHLYLAKLAVGKVWGIGPQTTSFLQKHGIETALDFASQSEGWVAANLPKPFREIWHELRGEAVYELALGEKHDYQSISKTKTFTPPSDEREFVFSQLSKNIENACIKARRHGLAAREIVLFLKRQDFRYAAREFKLSSPTSAPQELVSLAREYFDDLFKKGALYRATGVVLLKLESNTCTQLDLFGSSLRASAVSRVYEVVDALSERYGKHAVFLGSSFRAMTTPPHKGDRSVALTRTEELFKGETKRKRLAIPMLGEAS